MISFIKGYLKNRAQKRLRRILRPGKIISKFIAKDVKREVLIVSLEEIETGFIKAQVRTLNVLYLSKGLIEKQSFGPPERIEINKLWDWPGQSWGGPSNGRSIVDYLDSSVEESENVG